MIQANELRIGNYYIDIDDKLIELSGYELWQMTVKENTDNLGVNEYRPVPLTEKWIIDFDVLFGFNYLGSWYEFEIDLNGYHLRLSTGIGMSKFIGRVDYVHQLQNLYFALTGKELKQQQNELAR